MEHADSYKDKASLQAAIQGVRYRGGSTATNEALRYVKSYHFAGYHGARPNATRLVIVLTDGQSTNTGLTVNEAMTLKVDFFSWNNNKDK